MFANACTTSMTKPAFQWKCFAGGERRAFSACTSALVPASSIFPKTGHLETLFFVFWPLTGRTVFLDAFKRKC